MLDQIKDIYTAKYELAKLEGVDRASNLLAKTLGVLLQVMASVIGVITLLVLIAIGVGFLANNYMLGIAVCSALLIIMVLVVVFMKDQVIITPLKNLIVKSFYENNSK